MFKNFLSFRNSYLKKSLCFAKHMTRETTSTPYWIRSTCFCMYLIYLWHIKESNVEFTRQLCALLSIRRNASSHSSSILGRQYSFTHSEFLYGPRPLLSSTDASLEPGVRNSLAAWMYVFMRVCYVVHMEALRGASHLSKELYPTQSLRTVILKIRKDDISVSYIGIAEVQLLL
jgi:hypothetical protein